MPSFVSDRASLFTRLQSNATELRARLEAEIAAPRPERDDAVSSAAVRGLIASECATAHETTVNGVVAPRRVDARRGQRYSESDQRT